MPPKQKKRKVKRQRKGNVITNAKTRKTKDGKVSQVVNVYVTKGGGRGAGGRGAGGRVAQAPRTPQPVSNPLLRQIQPLQDTFLAGINTLNQSNELLSELINRQRYNDASLRTDILTNDKLKNAVKKETDTIGTQTENPVKKETATIETQTPQIPKAEEIKLMRESATIGTQYAPPKPKLTIGSDTSLSEGDVSFLENPDFYKGLISGANMLNQYIGSDIGSDSVSDIAGSDVAGSDVATTPISGYNVYDEGIITPNNIPTPTPQTPAPQTPMTPQERDLEIRYEELKGQLREMGLELPRGRRPTRIDVLQNKIADMETQLQVARRSDNLNATAI
jgi:hypothetical protein